MRLAAVRIPGSLNAVRRWVATLSTETETTATSCRGWRCSRARPCTSVTKMK